MPEPLDSDAAMPQVLFCYHGWPACSFSASSIRITPPSFSSFSHAPFPLSSNRLRCVWMQTKLALLALGNAVLTFLLQYGRVELHCIALHWPSKVNRWGILAWWWASVSPKGVQSLMDGLQTPNTTSDTVGNEWLVSKERTSVFLNHHSVCALIVSWHWTASWSCFLDVIALCKIQGELTLLVCVSLAVLAVV